MINWSEDSLFLTLDEVLHDTHFVLVPADKPVLDLSEHRGRLRPIQLSILFLYYFAVFRPILARNHDVFILSKFLHVLPLQTSLIQDIAFISQRYHVLHHFTIFGLLEAY